MSSISLDKQAKARAFAELVMLVKNYIEKGTYEFKLAELHAAYKNHIQHLHVGTSINRTWLKEGLLDYFKKYGIQEQFDGNNVILLFPGGMQEILQNACLLSEYKFPKHCQEDSMSYNLKLLVSMIFNEPSLKSKQNIINSQVCLTISQIILCNDKKKHAYE